MTDHHGRARVVDALFFSGDQIMALHTEPPMNMDPPQVEYIDRILRQLRSQLLASVGWKHEFRNVDEFTASLPDSGILTEEVCFTIRRRRPHIAEVLASSTPSGP